ncbi:MAG: glycosyltransferase [Lachnospiraceae bacterium]|nr:glycosyltransferase [Lachnospiraceae bacterium]
MPNIAFIINSLSNGGAERTISNITNNLPPNFRCDIIVNCDSEIIYPVKGNIIPLGFRPEKNKLKIRYQAVAFLRRVRALKKLKKNNDYVAVFSFSESASIANILSGKDHCKIILSVRNHLSSRSCEWKYRFFVFPIIKMLYGYADKIVAVSEGVRVDLIKNFGIKESKAMTIPNGCDVNRIEEMSLEELSQKEAELLSYDSVIVTMGRLEHQKGQWHLIRALRAVKDRGLRFRLLILGQGSMLDTLKEVALNNGLQEDVRFLGFCNNPFRILRNADLYVLPSLFEGMVNSLIEALACGLPCISTDHNAGAREILAPKSDVELKNVDRIERAEYGIMIPVPNGQIERGRTKLSPEESLLADAIAELLSNKSLRENYRLKAIERSKTMAIEHTITMWMDLVEKVI